MYFVVVCLATKASKFNPPIEFALREGKVATPKVQHLNYQSCKSSFLYIFVSESGKTPLCITYFDVSYVLDVLSSSSRPHSKQDRKKSKKNHTKKVIDIAYLRGGIWPFSKFSLQVLGLIASGTTKN